MEEGGGNPSNKSSAIESSELVDSSIGKGKEISYEERERERNIKCNIFLLFFF